MAKTTKNNGQGSQQGQGSKHVPVNQYGSEILNKLSTSIDLTDPNGLEMSAAFDKYVEKVIKPIYPKGTKIKQTSRVDDASGMRYVDWSFRDTNNKIMQAVQSAVDNFTQGWGQSRGILDKDGNLIPTAGKVPMRVGGITPQEFKTTITRILNPRTAASVRAKATNAGGSFTTDKNSGKSSWSVPTDALTDEGKLLYRSLRAEVREGDKRWTEGSVALSSLAEGASPASPEERAIATRNRNLRVAMAKAKAMSPEQEKEELVMKLERRSRIAMYEREYEKNNPEEFQARINRSLDKTAERDRLRLEWAKRPENRGNPLAKAIRKAHKRETATGRALHRSISLARGAVISGLLTAITGAIGMAVKFLSSLPMIASNVHKIAVKGAHYNIDNGLMAKYRQFSNAVGLGETGEAFSSVQGSIHSRLSSVMNGDINSSIGKIAGVSAIAGGQAIDAMIAYFTNGSYKGEKVDNPDVVMRTVANDVMAASFAGNSVQAKGIGINAAFSRNVADAEADFGMGEMLSRLFEYWQDIDNADVKNDIREKTLAGGDFIQLMMDYVESSGGGASSRDVATPVQNERAEEVAKSFERLHATFTAIKEGILTKILSALEPLSNWLRSILKAVLTFLDNYGPLKGQFTETVATMNAEDATLNMRRREVNNYQTQVTEMQVTKLRQQYGLTDTEKRVAAISNFEKGVLPEGMSWKEASNYFGAERLYAYTKNKEMELSSPAARNGNRVVSGVSPTTYGTDVYGYLSKAGHEYSTGIEKVIERYTTDPNKGLWRSLYDAYTEFQDKTYEYKYAPARDKGTVVDRYATNATGVYDEDLNETFYGKDFEDGRENHIAAREAYLQKIQQAIDLIPDILRGDAKYQNGELQLPVAVDARRESEEVTVASQAVEAIRASALGSDFMRILEDGTARVVVDLQSDKRELTIKLVDAETGKERGRITDIYNPVQGSSLIEGSFDLTNITDAFSATQR